MTDDPLAACSWPTLSARYAAALRGAVAYVLSEVDAVGVVATGTIVRGTAHASSDLDVYAVHEAPQRRRIQRLFGETSLGPPVPVEVFVNPPSAVRTYFAGEHAAGRPITAHMLATGHVVLARGPIIGELRTEAANWLGRPSYPTSAQSLRTRYEAASRYEDAADVAESDPATANMLLGQAVPAMLEHWCRTQIGTVPRGKDLLARVAALDAALGALAATVYSGASFAERWAAAAEVADRTIGARGFFEWDSGFEAVPARTD